MHTNGMTNSKVTRALYEAGRAYAVIQGCNVINNMAYPIQWEMKVIVNGSDSSTMPESDSRHAHPKTRKQVRNVPS